MKANELMIGDWAYDTLSQTNIKVNRRCFEINPLNGICYAENLIPIPLAKVHLTKNSFEATNESDTEFVYGDGGFEVRVEFDEGLEVSNIPPCIYLRIEFAEKELVMPIEYLHQLQQAMRIMGCDKEIEL